MQKLPWIVLSLGALLLFLLLGGCDMPRDPQRSLEGALARGTLHAGIDAESPTADTERECIEAFARGLGVAVVWETGAGPDLLRRLCAFDLDLAVADLRPEDPWREKVGFSVPWTPPDAYAPRVVAVAPGENALLMRLDRHLLESGQGVNR